MIRQIHYFLAAPHNEQRTDLIQVIEDALHSLNLEPVNTMDIQAGDLWQGGLRRAIERADIVILDISGENPNVMFEAGIVTTLNKPAIFLIESTSSEIPAVISRYQVIVYHPEAPDGHDKIRTHLRLWVRSLLETRQARREKA